MIMKLVRVGKQIWGFDANKMEWVKEEKDFARDTYIMDDKLALLAAQVEKTQLNVYKVQKELEHLKVAVSPIQSDTSQIQKVESESSIV